MDLGNLLGDSNSGLLGSATAAGKQILLEKTEDNNSLHPLLANLLGSDAAQPSPATPETKQPAPANLPQTDLPMEEGFFSRYKWWLIGGAVLLVAAPVVLRAMK